MQAAATARLPGAQTSTIAASALPAAAAAAATRDAPAGAATHSDRSAQNPPATATDPSAATAAAADAASDPFAVDPITAALLEFVQSLADGEVAGAVITPQQASVLRYLLTRPWRRPVGSAGDADAEAAAIAAQPERRLLLALQADHSAASVARFHSALASLVDRRVSMESRCRSSQLDEVEALRAIFGGGVRELSVYMTHPVAVKVAVQTEEIDCRVEVGASMPPAYPDEEPLHVCAFVPPPFQGLRIAVEAEHSSERIVMMSVEEALQSLLDRRAVELAQDGESAVYTLVEETRAFLALHSEALLAALAARDGIQASSESTGSSGPQTPSSSSSVMVTAPLQIHPVTLWDRGHIERLESAAIRDVQLACDLPESLARAALRESRWDVAACIADVQRKAETAGTSAASDAIPATSLRPILRQDSLPDRARFALLQEALAPFLADPQRTLECGACGDVMQLREAAGQVCAHMLCVACWRRMLATHIAQGEAFIGCPGYRCASQVEEGLLLALAPSPAHYARYRRWLQNSFVQLRAWRFCPNPRCDRVVTTPASATSPAPTPTLKPGRVSAGSAANPDPDSCAVVSCDCLTEWCLSCGRDGHWPLECGAAERYGSIALVSLLRQLGEPAPQAPEGPARFFAEFDSALAVECKPCPNCSTLWFRDGGCDHITCQRCMHEYCLRCLRPHPCQWSDCVEVPMTKLLFTEGGRPGGGLGGGSAAVTITDDTVQARVGADGKMRVVIEDVDLIAQLGGVWIEKESDKPKDLLVHLPLFVRKEAVHHRARRRLLTMLRLLDTTQLPVLATNAADGTASVISADQAELNSLLIDLTIEPSQRRTLASLLAFLRQCHGLLHGCCMYLAIHGRRLEGPGGVGGGGGSSKTGARVLESLAQLDYFVRALDEVLLPSADHQRALRTLARMSGADRSSAFKCAVALRESMGAFRCEEEKTVGPAGSAADAALEQRLREDLTAAAASLTLTPPANAGAQGASSS